MHPIEHASISSKTLRFYPNMPRYAPNTDEIVRKCLDIEHFCPFSFENALVSNISRHNFLKMLRYGTYRGILC